MDKSMLDTLIKIAVKSREMAYAPYSRYKVGASILCGSGKIFSGCNYENVSPGAGVCAERVALGNAIANGETKFIAVCVSGEKETITPCGICRQSLSEFGDMDVICCNASGTKYKIHKLSDILAFSFSTIQ